MSIKELLQKTDARITVGNRWLVWDEQVSTWKVYERRPYKKNVSVVVSTDREEEAVRELVKD